MESISVSQLTIGKEIEKILNSYQQLSPDKKSLTYLQNTLKTIEDLFESFKNNDEVIQKHYCDNRNHTYFTSRYFTKVKAGYEKIREDIVALIEHVKRSSANESQLKEINVAENKLSNTTSSTSSESVNVSNNIGRKQTFLMSALKNAISQIQFDEGLTKQYFEVKLETIKNYWHQIEAENLILLETHDNSPMNEYFELETQVQDVTIKLKQFIDKNGRQGLSNNPSFLKLPKIEIPKFDGNYLKWNQFYDLFNQMVHNQNMASSQKMWYLKLNLTGDAEKLIRHLTVTDENYNIAWNLLKERYDNKRIIVTTLLDKLLAQPKITTESAAALKNLHDTTKECILSLSNMGLTIKDHWDPIIMHTLLKKIDNNTHALYEQTLASPRELQSVDRFLTFLETRFQALESMGKKDSKQNSKSTNSSSLMINKKNRPQCPVCNEAHVIYFCEKFKNMNVQDRHTKAKELKLCLNCLRKGHIAQKCSSRGCTKCGRRHNTLIHISSSAPSDKNNKPNQEATNLAAQSHEDNGYVFLGTAIAKIDDNDGNPVNCRVLLDSGSQLNFITDKLRKRLKLSNTHVNMNISGIGDAKVKVNDRITITMKNKQNAYPIEFGAYSIKEITKYQPQQYINIDKWEFPSNITLADPDFNQPQKVDILLGAELYGEIIRNGQIKLGEGLPILQNTVLGWIVFGKVADLHYNEPFCGISNVELEAQLQKFWDLEECPKKQLLSISDQKCEEYFESTTIRNDDGRFIVNLPILADANVLGDSKQMAFKRLTSIERRLSQNPELKKQYTDFLDEYQRLGHMREISTKNLKQPYCFLPHHFVLKPSSSTTKLRVVFDGSARTSTNVSLNDIMLKGPKVQEDIIAIMLRFRTKKYVFTADINKMYRQILISEEDQNMQLIMWRKEPTDPIKFYQLCTVTYGTKAAPYLAIKCLRKLAEEEKDKYPLAARAINDFYVDDVLSGSNDLTEAMNTQQQLDAMMKSGGFQLRKWCANHPNLVQNIPNEDLEIKLNFNEIDGDESIKTLGLVWHPITDSFQITVSLKDHKIITKRSVLADMAHIFDPLDLINPITVTSKIFLQQLWKLKLDWDDELPIELNSAWLQFRKDLYKLNDIVIPRFVFSDESSKTIQLHAFSDASEKAYGAAVYVRTVDTAGHITSRLLCSKSKLAPLKPTTLPRLELCAALLTSQLVGYVLEKFDVKVNETLLWTDSQIVLSWLKGDASTLKPFVANRVAAIQELSKNIKWRYINTKYNPADIISRGMYPEQLRKSKL